MVICCNFLSSLNYFFFRNSGQEWDNGACATPWVNLAAVSAKDILQNCQKSWPKGKVRSVVIWQERWRGSRVWLESLPGTTPGLHPASSSTDFSTHPPKAGIFPEKSTDICIEAHHLGSPDAVKEVLQSTVHLVIKQVPPGSNRGAEGNDTGGLVQTKKSTVLMLHWDQVP